MDEAAAQTLLRFTEDAGIALGGLDAKPVAERLAPLPGRRGRVQLFLDHGFADEALRMAPVLVEFRQSTGRIAEGRARLDRALSSREVEAPLPPRRCSMPGCSPSGRARTTPPGRCTRAA